MGACPHCRSHRSAGALPHFYLGGPWSLQGLFLLGRAGVEVNDRCTGTGSTRHPAPLRWIAAACPVRPPQDAVRTRCRHACRASQRHRLRIAQACQSWYCAAASPHAPCPPSAIIAHQPRDRRLDLPALAQERPPFGTPIARGRVAQMLVIGAEIDRAMAARLTARTPAAVPQWTALALLRRKADMDTIASTTPIRLGADHARRTATLALVGADGEVGWREARRVRAAALGNQRHDLGLPTTGRILSQPMVQISGSRPVSGPGTRNESTGGNISHAG